MGANKESTLVRFHAYRRGLVGPKITEHRGRIVKTTDTRVLKRSSCYWSTTKVR